jgi:SnoaL-like domain
VSQENVDALFRGNEAFRRGDWEAVAANMDPDILIRTDPRWPEQRIYGRRAALAFHRGLWESGGSDVRIEEAIDLGDRVLMRMRWAMHGHLSGVEGEQPTSVIYTFRERRVILEEFFIEHDDALKAVGLSE